MSRGLAGEIRRRPRDLDERELQRQAGIAALTLVLDGNREEIAEPQDRRLRKLVRLLPEPVACLLGHRQRARHLELAFEVGENGGESEPELEEPVSEEEIIELMRGTLDAREVEPE